MDKSFYFGKWVGDELVLDGPDMARNYTDENGNITAETTERIQTYCYIDVKEDGGCALNYMGEEADGTWIDVADAIAFVPEGCTEEQAIAQGFSSLEDVAMKIEKDGDRVFIDDGRMKVYYKK